MLAPPDICVHSIDSGSGKLRALNLLGNPAITETNYLLLQQHRLLPTHSQCGLSRNGGAVSKCQCGTGREVLKLKQGIRGLSLNGGALGTVTKMPAGKRKECPETECVCVFSFTSLLIMMIHSFLDSPQMQECRHFANEECFVGPSMGVCVYVCLCVEQHGYMYFSLLPSRVCDGEAVVCVCVAAFLWSLMCMNEC